MPTTAARLQVLEPQLPRRLHVPAPGGVPRTEPDVDETITYGVLYIDNGTVSFTGDWTVAVRLPDGSTATGGLTGVTVPTASPVGTVSYVVPGSAAGTTLSAWISQVVVVNTDSSPPVTVSCTATGSPSQIDLQVPAAPPPTEPPPTEPPATEPPPTEPPATEPPATEPPATEPPATEPPATEPPGTEPPATEPPGTEPPGTDPPGTDPPGTDPPGTDPAGTGSPTTTTPVTTSPGRLPFTGLSSTSLAATLFGLALLTAGVAAVAFARRS